MKSLFVKIFVAFCATIILGVAISFIVLGWLFPREDRIESRRAVVRHNLRLAGATAVRIYEERGPKELAGFVRELEGDGHGRLFVLDADGRELTGRPLPPEALRFSGRPEGNRETRPAIPPPELLDLQVQGPSKKSYTVVRHLLRPVRPWGRPSPYHITLAGLLLASMVLCFFLARHFVAPLRTLQAAARRLAAGDLSARVGFSLGDRNDEFGKLARDFDHMAGRLEHLVEIQRRLMRDVSHELRSPLTRLAVALELTREQAPSELLPFLERIGKEAYRLNHLIEQILTLARLEEGRDVREGAPVAMDRVVGEVAKDARFEAQALDVGVETPRLDAAVVTGEAELLRSAVENVVRNAVRYSPRGGVVSVSVERGEDGPQKRVAVIVEDQGRGIPENQLDYLFRPFYRVEDARDRKTGGTGLGLAIADRAVRLHGGRISAENRREGGLRVVIDLPRA